MKKVIITNATISLNYKKEVITTKKIEKGTFVNFSISTPVNDFSTSRAKMYEQCYIFTNNTEKINALKNIIQEGSIFQIKGTEERTKNEKDGKYYSKIKVEELIPMTSTMIKVDEQPGQLPF